MTRAWRSATQRWRTRSRSMRRVASRRSRSTGSMGSFAPRDVSTGRPSRMRLPRRRSVAVQRLGPVRLRKWFRRRRRLLRRLRRPRTEDHAGGRRARGRAELARRYGGRFDELAPHGDPLSAACDHRRADGGRVHGLPPGERLVRVRVPAEHPHLRAGEVRIVLDAGVPKARDFSQPRAPEWPASVRYNRLLGPLARAAVPAELRQARGSPSGRSVFRVRPRGALPAAATHAAFAAGRRSRRTSSTP